MFSVVIPLYNKEKTIARTLHSILAQTYQDFEVFVVDDGSEDRGPDIVKSFGDHRVHLISQSNAGESSARNLGINRASRPYVALLDADDEWRPEYLARICRLIEDFPAAEVYATAYYMAWPNGQIESLSNAPRSPWRGYLNYFRSSSRGASVIHSSAITIKKSITTRTGLFSESLKIGADVEFWCRLQLAAQIAYDATPSTIYYLCAPSSHLAASSAQSIENVCDGPNLRLIQGLLRKGNIPEHLVEDAECYVESLLYNAVRIMIYNRNGAGARRFYSQIRSNKFIKSRLFYGFLLMLPKSLLDSALTFWSRRNRRRHGITGPPPVITSSNA